jgi:beta-glucosidase
MTLGDKIAMVHQPDPFGFHYGAAGWIPANARLCIPDLVLSDGGAGVADVELGTTAFPAPIAQAASWNPALQRRVGQAMGEEAHNKGIDVLLGPAIEIDRTPLNGRNFEYFSEDPYLAGQAAAAEVRGIQSAHVIATIKHFIANSQETNRNTVSSDLDERTLHELYAAPYETAIKLAHPGSVMCSYNRINSGYSCENPTTLTGLLKRTLHFAGFVMSDWGATHSTVASAKAGLDMEMDAAPGRYFGSALAAAIQTHQVPLARLNDMVFRIARAMFAVGVFDHPPAAQPHAFLTNVSTPVDQQTAASAEEQGAVLLKNDRHVLPLSGREHQIALIGTDAGPIGAQLTYGGGGSSHVPLAGVDPVQSPLQTISARAGSAGAHVLYADGTLIADAVAVAKASDVAVVFVNDAETEGSDRPDLNLTAGACDLVCVKLPGNPVALINAVAAANPNTIVVLESGGPVVMPWLSHVRGVLEAWYPGSEGAQAITSLLFGDSDPAGRLPETFPRSESQLPTRTAAQYPGITARNGVPHAKYSEGVFVGYRYFQAARETPLFPFGFGLSYTSFRFSGLHLKRLKAGRIAVHLTASNTGARGGYAVPELYVGLPSTRSVPEPPRQLAGFSKVWLAPGASARVTMILTRRSLAYWNVRKHRWSVARGCDRVLVGSSSSSVPLRATIAQSARCARPRR